MFEDKKITKEKIKSILYAVQNEFENEVDSIDDIFEREISDDEINFGSQLLRKYIDKLELVIDDEVEDND